jgi:hypothetical protein
MSVRFLHQFPGVHGHFWLVSSISRGACLSSGHSHAGLVGLEHIVALLCGDLNATHATMTKRWLHLWRKTGMTFSTENSYKFSPS